MANGYNNIDQAYVLPKVGIDTQYLALKQNKEQLEEQRQQRLQQRQQQNQWRNLGLIQDDLDFKKYQTGEQAIDNYAQSELNKISQEAMRSHINDEPAQLEYWMQSQLAPLNKWHTMALTEYKNLDKTLQDYNKTYPNVDYSKARDLVLNKFQNDFLDVDDNGNISRKNTDFIKPTDYSSFLQAPETLGFLNNDTSAFSKFFYDIPKTSIGGSEYTNKKGVVNAFKWSGMMPEGIGEVVTDDDNKPTGVRMRGDVVEGVTDAQGNQMRILPQDVYDRMKGNPAVYSAALGMWQRAKPNIENAYMQRTGQPLTPDIEDKLRSAYLYNEANRLISHDVKTEEKSVEPKPPRISVNVGRYGEVGINDIYDEVATKSDSPNRPHHRVPLNELSATAQNVILKLARDITSNNDLSQRSIFVGRDADGEIWVYRAGSGSKITSLGFKDVNIPANNSVKQKQAILKRSNNAPSSQTKSKDADPLGIF